MRQFPHQHQDRYRFENIYSGVHSGPITSLLCIPNPCHNVTSDPKQLKELYNGYQFVTTSKDGSICVWASKDPEEIEGEKQEHLRMQREKEYEFEAEKAVKRLEKLKNEQDEEAEGAKQKTAVDLKKEKLIKLGVLKPKPKNEQNDNDDDDDDDDDAETVYQEEEFDSGPRLFVYRYIPNAHAGAVNDLCISRSGRMALTGSADRTLKLWDLDTGITICKCFNPNDNAQKDILSCALVEFEVVRDPKKDDFQLEDGTKFHLDSFIWALSGSKDCTIRLWNLPIYRARDYFNRYFDKGEQAKYFKDPENYRFEGVRTGQCLRVFKASENLGMGWVNRVQWSIINLATTDILMEKGQGVQAQGLNFISCCDQGRIKVWQITDNKPLIEDILEEEDKHGGGDDKRKHVEPSTIKSYIFESGLNPDSSRYYVANSNEHPSDFLSNEHEQNNRRSRVERYDAPAAASTAIAVSPDGSLCAHGGKNGQWYLNAFVQGTTNQRPSDFTMLYDDKFIDDVHQEPVLHLCYSPVRYWMVIVRLSTVEMLDLENKETLSAMDFLSGGGGGLDGSDAVEHVTPKPKFVNQQGQQTSASAFRPGNHHNSYNSVMKAKPLPTTAAIYRDGNWLYVGFNDGSVQVFEFTSFG